jgi:hypothetical protein
MSIWCRIGRPELAGFGLAEVGQEELKVHAWLA